ncbi:alpha/beta fold hydrolase [Acidovorax sp. GBBC 3334]|nr:alpha/beta fold hydrolase [Acidovorax sp. GBBC 3334]MDA8455319.1 alpha/beta fold hydrolase [Acidovorax sp. GBBC 3334]
MTAELPEDVARLAARAEAHATPCGAGAMVWRVWRVAGTGAGALPPLVLLHGGSGSWMHWVRNIDTLLSWGRTVCVPDLPGFGDSAVPATGSDADALVAPLAEGMQALWGGAPCDLVGFSFGGLAAGLLLAAEPALARQLVLVGAPAMGVVPQRQFTLKAWRHLPTEAQAAVHRHNLAELMLHDAALIEGLALQVHCANVVRDRMPRRRLAHTDALARALPAVRCPVQAIYGERDALYKGFLPALESAYRTAAADFRGLSLVPDAGHWVQFEQPAPFADALAAALAAGA